MIEIRLFKKKPVEVEAVLYTGTNFKDIKTFTLNKAYKALSGGVYISTLEGNMHFSWGDWVIKGIKGEFYPCKPDIFNETYEEINELS